MGQIIFEPTAARQALKSRSLRLLVEAALPEILAARDLGISWEAIAKNFQATHERVWFDAPRKMTVEAGRAKKKAEVEDPEGLRAKIEEAKSKLLELAAAPAQNQNRTAPVAHAPVAVSRPAVASAPAFQMPAAPVAPAPVAASRPAVVAPAGDMAIQNPAPPVGRVSVEIPPELAPGTFVPDPSSRLPRDRPFVWLLAEVAKCPHQEYYTIPDGRPGREDDTLPVPVSRPGDLLSGKITDWEGLYAAPWKRK